MQQFSATEIAAIGGVLIFVFLAVNKILDLIITYIFKKTVTTEYVTVAKCDELREKCAVTRNCWSVESEADRSLLREAVLMLLKYSKDVPDEVKNDFMKNMVK